MPTVTIRRQGGAAIMTVPPAVLNALQLDIGSALEVEVAEGALVARPARARNRKRYSLRELLRGATPQAVKELADATAWARDGGTVGREI